MAKCHYRILHLSWISLVSLVLTGCATSMERVPQKSPTMLQVYNAAMQDSMGNSLNHIRQRLPNTDGDASHSNPITLEKNSQREYSRGTLALSQQFPLLPNPEIELYVYPHLAEQSEVPVQGYPTAFTLYKKEYFALPGETSARDG